MCSFQQKILFYFIPNPVSQQSQHPVLSAVYAFFPKPFVYFFATLIVASSQVFYTFFRRMRDFIEGWDIFSSHPSLITIPRYAKKSNNI